MLSRSKVSAVTAVIACACACACACALAGCSSQAASSSSASSGSSASASSSSSATASAASSATSASASAAAAATATATASTASAAAAAGKGTAVIDLDYNAGTGYEWTYSADPEGIVELMGQRTADLADEDVTGGPLQDSFTFRALQPGEVAITFDLVRGWESEEEPAETQVYAFTVTDDLQMILNPYKSDFTNEPTVG